MNNLRRKTIRVHPAMYARIEQERQRFMKKNGLNRLTTAAFTGLLDVKLIERKNAKKNR